MPNPNADQLNEVTYISGVNADGTAASDSYAAWAHTSSYLAYTAKWGTGTAGTGANVTVSFDPGSHWSAAEQAQLTSAMHLWSAVANINFTILTDGSAGQVTVSRGSDGQAEGGITDFNAVPLGSATIGTGHAGSISIDTSVPGFGPMDGSFSTAGGYVWETAIHEWGHVLGLGHAGPYNGGGPLLFDEGRAYDNRAWSIMSYLDPQNNSPFFAEPDGGVTWGFVGGTALEPAYNRDPTTWMPLDVLAAQRLYGVATDGPLSSGGQIFGFHSNIAGDIHNFFDFTINQTPVITIWDGGAHNTLDVSGYSADANISLEAGSFSSVDGLTNNIAIAYDTKIETAIGGSGNDTVHANDLSDVLMGGAGQDSLIGGAGNDHIYGNMATSVAGTTDGADYIDVGAGMNYANGNAGNDTIVAADGPDRLFGGQGDDHITTGNGADSINGNLGNDVITVGNGKDTVHGGQGDDVIHVGSGNDLILGDLGNDTIFAGSGHDVITGGDGADLFVFTAGSAAIEEVTDFSRSAGDLLDIGVAVSASHVLHDAGMVFASEALAADAASTLIGTQSGVIAALEVGSDTYLFFNSGGVGEVIHLDGISAASIDSSAFTLV